MSKPLNLSQLDQPNLKKINPSVKSTAEAEAWNEGQCEASKGSEKYKANQKRCMKKNDTGMCTTGRGDCFFNRHENRNVCRICYRFAHI